MKKILISLFSLCTACSSATYVTGSWKSTKHTSFAYKNILVAALTDHVVARSTVEDALVAALSGHFSQVLRSIDVFPPKAGKSDTDETAIMRKVFGKNIDAILTVSLLRKGTENRYVPGSTAYDPFRYDYNRSFWGYYTWSYDRYYMPGYFTEDTVYYIETNLYDMKSMDLVWSAQSKTYQGIALQTFSKDFAKSLVKEMKHTGILPEGKKNSPKDANK
jgi:hypothetical protein